MLTNCGGNLVGELGRVDGGAGLDADRAAEEGLEVGGAELLGVVGAGRHGLWG